MLTLNVYRPILRLLFTFLGPLNFLALTAKAQLKAALALKLHATISPPTIAANLQVFAKIAAKFQAAIKAGLTPPSFHVGLNALLKLKLLFDKWNALVTGFGGGAQVMIYEGPVGGFGSAVQAAAGASFTPPLVDAEPVHAVTLLVAESDSISTTTLQKMFAPANAPLLPQSKTLAYSLIFSVFLGPLAAILAVLTPQLLSKISLAPVLGVTFPNVAVIPTLLAAIPVQLAAALAVGIVLPAINLTIDPDIAAILGLEVTLNGLLSVQGAAQMMVYEGELGQIGKALAGGTGNAPGSPQVTGNVYAVTLLVDATDAESVASLVQAFGLA